LPKFSLANYESNLINFLNENYTLYDNWLNSCKIIYAINKK
jgi:hypothetical protein